MPFKPIEQVIKENNDRENEVFSLYSIGKESVPTDINNEDINILPAEFFVNNTFSDTSESLETDTETHLETEQNESPVTTKKKRSFISSIYNFIFYFVIFGAVLLAVITFGKNGGSPPNIFGYSYFTVLTGSMQNEIPIGSFVLTKETDADELQVGDNITFMKDANTTVTHKIVGVYENYIGKGTRGFQTQGTNNAQPDRDLVDASNVVGKVIFTVPGIGAALSFLDENIVLAMVILGLLLLLSLTLQFFFQIRKEEEEEGKVLVAEIKD